MTWSGVDLAFHCLADVQRTQTLIEALKPLVGRDSVVLDAGSGSGVLAYAAAKLGASKVLAVESDPFLCRIMEHNFRNLDLPIDVICGDLKEVQLPNIDIVVAEILDVWLLEEDFFDVLDTFADKKIIGDKTIILPTTYQFNIEFGLCKWDIPYFPIPWPFYQWNYYQNSRWRLPTFFPLLVRDNAYCFDANTRSLRRSDGNVEITINLTKEESLSFNDVNAARISGTIYFGKDTKINHTGALNAPLVIPLKRREDIAEPTQNIIIRGKLSKGIRNLSISNEIEELVVWHS